MRRTSGRVLLASSTVYVVRMSVLCAVRTSRSSLTESRLLGGSFLETTAAPRLGRVTTANLILCLGNEPRNLHRLSIPVDRDESQVAGVGVPSITRLKILSFNSHTDFHRRAADKVHAALHYHQVA